MAQNHPLSVLTHASWKSTLSSRLLVEAGLISPNNAYNEEPSVPLPLDTAAVIDTGTGLTYRSAPFSSSYYKAHYIQPTVRFATSYVTGTHVAKVGFDVGWGANGTRISIR